MGLKTTLYRPVGPKELDLIRESGFSRFPPRLAEQPIFYPVVQEAYARKIAHDWNVGASGIGFVMRFQVRSEYLRKFEEHRAGGRDHTEYWIPADELEEFNDSIVGAIEMIAEYSSDEWCTVYDLAEDAETIALVQRATLTTKDFGLVAEVALFGSDDWWAATKDGRIPRHDMEGTISCLFLSGHGDWPEFELDCDGNKTRWTRVGNQSLYAEGKQARVEYVMQKLRKDLLGQGEKRQILRVLVRR